jgi:hypothetical protein
MCLYFVTYLSQSWANIPALLETMKEYPNTDWLWWIDSVNKILFDNEHKTLNQIVIFP